MKPDAWDAFVIEQGFSKDELNKIQDLLANDQLWERSTVLPRIFEMIAIQGFSDYVQFDPEIIRGLDYYTGTVFEGFDVQDEGRAILGGGHYDNLVAAVGGQPLPGVGFAMGDVVIGQLIENTACR